MTKPTLREIAAAVVALFVGATGTYGAVQKTPIEAVVAAQEEYKTVQGKYFQCIEYLAPEGVGFQIIYETDTEVKSVGSGPEAASRTYTKTKPSKAATSTK